MDIEILRFIKSYYPQAYGHISAIMKYAISQDVVVTFNSFTEYSFLLKFQSHNKELNTRIENFVKKYTHTKINISDNPNNRFYEIIINIFPSFHIENFRLYSEEKKENFKTIPEYCKHENIFMTLFIQEEIFRNSTVQKNTGVLYKLNQPIVFSDSTFLKKEFGEMLSPYFSLENIYLAFVEKMDNSDNDILYFTDGFFIPA
ncbi:hypothetical protein LAT59_03895 [Candidatus Gracilibacteria bacterium]|nr:hypothetical protein [Candidatus Gracilibacteria bacterium]